MKCERIQEIILTDYLDQELDSRYTKEIELHLADCPSCREFLAISRQTTAEPFAMLKDAPISEKVLWNKIKADIAPSFSKPQTDFLSRLKELLSFPRIAFLLPVLMFLIIWSGFFFRPQTPQLAQTQRQEETFDFTDEYLVSQDDETEGYGSDIEEYFL